MDCAFGRPWRPGGILSELSSSHAVVNPRAHRRNYGWQNINEFHDIVHPVNAQRWSRSPCGRTSQRAAPESRHSSQRDSRPTSRQRAPPIFPPNPCTSMSAELPITADSATAVPLPCENNFSNFWTGGRNSDSQRRQSPINSGAPCTSGRLGEFGSGGGRGAADGRRRREAAWTVETR